MTGWRIAGAVVVAISGVLAAGCGRTELFPAAPSTPAAPPTTALGALGVSAGPLSPAFDPDVLSYRVDAGFLVDSTTLTAAAADPRASLTLDDEPIMGAVTRRLAPGTNTFLFTVTVPGGQSRTYTVTVERSDTLAQTAYVKASNTGAGDHFGNALAIDGDTMAIGAYGAAGASGAVYIFRRRDRVWMPEATVKASNPDADDWFGYVLALVGDTLVVGAPHESSGAGGDPSDNSVPHAGAVYVFTRSGGAWTQQAMVKTFNPDPMDSLGTSVALSGNVLVAGAYQEASAGRGVDSGRQADNSAPQAGAAYAFLRSGDVWTQEAYIKASNTGAGDLFGFTLALSGDTLVVGAEGEASRATGVDAAGQDDNGAPKAGAAYVFTRAIDGVWSQQAYVKASNPAASDLFGASVALAGDTLAVGAIGEDGGATGVYAVSDGVPDDDSVKNAGAVYTFRRIGATWIEDAYVKPPWNHAGADFGQVALAGDFLAVGAAVDPSGATGTTLLMDADTSAPGAGAVFLFERGADSWAWSRYIKASNTGTGDTFGFPVAIAGGMLVVGASQEDSAARGVNPPGQDDDSAQDSGAVYVFQ